MRVVCPNCDTAYDAPERVMAAGRPMRCARCRTTWTPGAAPDQAASAEAAREPSLAPATVIHPSIEQAMPMSEAPPVMRSVSPPAVPAEGEPYIRAPFPVLPDPPAGPRKVVIAAWAASLIGLAAALWLAIAFRHPIMQHWPASARAYAALGYK